MYELSSSRDQDDSLPVTIIGWFSLGTSDSQCMVSSGSQWFSVVTSDYQWLPAVLNGSQWLITSNSQ